MNKSFDSKDDDFRNDSHAAKDEQKSPEQLEREVDQARARLGRTASELSDRLSPGELIDQALGMAREHGGEFGRNLGAQVKHNPLPMILTSIGISWLMMSSSKNGSTYAHSSASGTHTNGSGVRHALSDATSTSRDKAAAMGDHMHDATAHVKESAQSARDSLVKFYRDQPLLAGSLGIAIGAALGALVPPTDFEDDTFGEASDRSVEAAKAEAAKKYDEVRDSARTQ